MGKKTSAMCTPVASGITGVHRLFKSEPLAIYLWSDGDVIILCLARSTETDCVHKKKKENQNL